MAGQMVDQLRRIADGEGPGAADAIAALGDGAVRERIRSSICALARHRGAKSSTCPSDAARAVGGADWRRLMDDARDVARELAIAGLVDITQGGDVIDPRQPWRGPIRIRVRD